MQHFVVFEHETSRALKVVSLLSFTNHEADIWWPLCGVYKVDLEYEGRLFGVNDNGRQWRMIPSDLKRLRRRRPVALYHPPVRYDDE